MKPFRSIYTTLVCALAVFSTAARGVTFQVLNDTVGLTKTSTIAKAAGAATTLPVSSKSTAYLSFGVAASGIAAEDVREARLVLYFPKITKPGTLTLTANGSSFTETFPTKTIPSPTAAFTVTQVAITAANAKNFLTIPVTTEVVGWLSGVVADNGFGLSGDAVVNVLVGAKEGSGSGYPAVLEIDTMTTTAPISGSSGVFTDRVGIGTTSPAFTLDLLNQGSGDLILNLEQAGSGGVGILQSNPSRSYITGLFEGSDRWSLFDATNNNLQERLTVAANGKVGIGTSTPGYQLEVAAGNSVEFALRSTSDNGRVYTLQSSDGGALLGDGSFQIIDRTAVAARMIIDKTGNIGLGLYPNASTKLDMVGTFRTKGDVKLGPTGQLFAVSGEENLRTIRGTVSLAGEPTVIGGSGFTVTRTLGPAVGIYTVTFNSAFTGTPSVTLTPYALLAGTARIASIQDLSSGAVTVRTYDTAGNPVDASFSFIAVGAR